MFLAWGHPSRIIRICLHLKEAHHDAPYMTYMQPLHRHVGGVVLAHRCRFCLLDHDALYVIFIAMMLGMVR